MEVFQSKKRIDGFSTCFRQHAAEGTHCKYLHGYGIYFEVIFEGTLDHRNWVADFGFMKRSKHTMTATKGVGRDLLELTPEAWFKFYFDHTTVVAQDDPFVTNLSYLDSRGTLQLRILPKVGCEMFAKFVYESLNIFIVQETQGRVRVVSVECFEHEKNSAIYKEK